MSPRASVPLVRLTCSAVPESILESELFGHEKGAFTGADRKKLGYFEAASGGTLFLDEIGDMPLPAQARLLSVLETGTVTRLGSTRPVPVDVRVLCATHRDLRREIAQGQFRQDLYYRIAGFTVLVPPLRERPGDIEPLALAFISRIAASMGVSAPSLSNEALEALQKHPWPGNVRELRNAVEHAVVTVEEGVIQSAHLALSDSDSLAQSSGHRPWNRLFPEEKERILAALDSEGGNQVRASQRLGMSRRMLLYRMEKYGITRSR
jgi:transcriptional regulator with GAF, ATPase, and Fis domain